MVRRSSIIVISLLLISFILFISGKETVRIPWARKTYVAGSSLYYNIHNLYAEKKSKELDSIFHKYNKAGAFNGTVIYGEHGLEIFKKSYGYADFGSKTPLTTSSEFQLAFFSKMFTATAIMILKERGYLEYDDTLTRFIPEFPDKTVTIRHLLNHRSGLANYIYLADEHWNTESPINNKDVIDLFVKYKPNNYFRPDKGFQYSNTNYALLGSVVERITGQAFIEFVKDNIFDPAGMGNSFVYQLSGDSIVSLAVPVGVPGYQSRSGRLVKVPDNYLNGVVGDKGVYSTVEDLFRFNVALDNQTLLSHGTLADAFMPGSPASKGRKDNYGFGWRIKTDMDSTVYHFGWWKGFRTYFIRDMKNERALIVLTNTTKGFSNELLWDIIKEDTEMQDVFSIYQGLPR
ncbi:MAG: beta-lactamase family protein [Bacteroidetes bacterium]|nr:beta-lactamase family protein [Bacteroidota bacterium]